MNDSLRPTDSPAAVRRYRVNYEAELNPEQLRVVMHPGGPMLALAGAGTGKTRTLVYRVSRLIEDGVPPARILLLTFTNKASREMLKRVEDLIDLGGGRVTGGTFHSVGNRILRRYAEVLGFSPKFSILDREDSADLMGSALADVSPDLPKRRLPMPSMLTNLYSFVTLLINILLGIALSPVNLLIAFGPEPMVVYVVWLGVSIVVVQYLFRQLKGVFISGRLLHSYLFHFFLYLCTAEIAPLLILGKLVLGKYGAH